MIWATVSSQSCFCWLCRASPSLAAKNIINLISVLTIWWGPWCLLLCCWKRVFTMTSAFSWQNSIKLCPASFCTLRPNLPVTPGVSWLPTSAFQSPIMKRTSFLGVSSRSITKNKASGDDGIPVELFQILKDDAVKVLHSICQQIWKTQQWPQDWKRSVFIPIPKEGSAKNAQTTAQLHSSHTLVK